MASPFQVDPFLHLVEDCKLTTVDTATDHQTMVYGSEEDDTAALKSLSAIEITHSLTKESLVSVIMNHIGDLLDVSHHSFYRYLVENWFFLLSASLWILNIFAVGAI